MPGRPAQPPATRFKYDVFLSHNSGDKPAVEQLAHRLRVAGLRPFLDKWHLVAGSTWPADLETALNESEVVAVFFGPAGEGVWRREEMRLALQKAVRAHDSFRLIPVLLPGSKPEQISGFLELRTWVDFRSGLDDERAFARLVAGIKGEAVEPGGFELPDRPAPYRGLLRFEEKDAGFFFGRDADIRRLLTKLARLNFIAVIGASGSGKSSLVRAGVIHRLNQDAIPGSREWHKLTVVPGADPSRALADQLSTLVAREERQQQADQLSSRFAERTDGLRTAVSNLLAGQNDPVLLVIDQFEEIFTHGPQPGGDQTALQQFIANITDAAAKGGESIRIVITLRADFVDRCLAFPALRRLLEEGQILLGNLNTEDLREAIVRPAQAVGAMFELGLVNLILRDVSGEPASLPLLQHVLHELWLARRGPWLTLQAYEDSQGVAGALSRRAQETYDGLDPAEKDIARHIFLRAVFLEEGVGTARRRVSRDELYPAGADRSSVDSVIHELASPRARLIVVDQNTVEISHEALIEKWPQIRSWIDEQRDGLRSHRRLTDAARLWNENARDESFLAHRGARLELVEEWAKSHPEEMTNLEMHYLAACVEQRGVERLNQARLQANGILASAAAQEDPLVGALLASELVNYPAPHGGLKVLRQIAEKRVPVRKINVDGERVKSAAFSPDGRRVVAVSEEGRVRFWSAEGSGDPVLLPERDGRVVSAAFSADGTRLVTASADKTARVWNAHSFEELAVLRGHEGPVTCAAFSHDGRSIVTAAEDCTARIWNGDGSGEPRVLEHPAAYNKIVSASFGADDTCILTMAPSQAFVWDAVRGEQLVRHPASRAVFSPTQRLVALSYDRTVYLFNIDDPREPMRLEGAEHPVFTPDGKSLVTVLRDLVSVRSVDGRGLALELTGHTKWIRAVHCNRDGRFIVTASSDRTARVWDIEWFGTPTSPNSSVGRLRDCVVLEPHWRDVYSAVLSPGGSTVVTVSGDGEGRLWRTYGFGEPLVVKEPTWGGWQPLTGATFSFSGTRILATIPEKAASVWDSLRPQDPISSALKRSGLVRQARFVGTADDRVITSHDHGRLTIWDLDDYESRIELRIDGDTAAPRFIVSRDETRIVGTLGRTLRVWTLPLDGKAEPKTTRFDGPISGLAPWGRDSALVATAEGREVVVSWIDGSRPPIRCPGSSVSKVQFSPDGRLATIYDYQTVWVMNVSEENQPRVLCDRSNPRVSLATFSLDGRKLLLVLFEGIVEVWDLSRNEQSIVLQGHQAEITAAEFSPDGRLVITASEDNTAKVWDLERGGESLSLEGHKGPVNSASFSRDGRRVVTSSNDGTARIWRVTWEGLLEYLRESTGETLSPAQRKKLLAG